MAETTRMGRLAAASSTNRELGMLRRAASFGAVRVGQLWREHGGDLGGVKLL